MSIGHWLIVLVIVLLLFGANKIPRLMGDMARGVKAFKQGLKDGDADETAPAPQAAVAPPPAPPVAPAAPAPQPAAAPVAAQVIPPAAPASAPVSPESAPRL